jgi:GTP cyclohydrolase IA
MTLLIDRTEVAEAPSAAGERNTPLPTVDGLEADGHVATAPAALEGPAHFGFVCGRQPDLEAAERAARDMLVALGVQVGDEGVRDTPRRVARTYAELLAPTPFEMTTFPNDEGYDEMVLVRDIEFESLCMHHLLPFRGRAHVAYLPCDRIVGLSKLPRLVEWFARDLQLQERLTRQVADALDRHLAPKGVGVVLEAEHSCMSVRGVRKPGSRTVTSALLGAMRDDARTRQEFLALTGVAG